MLTQEQNELLTRTGPGTPCGELMRRYWQPAALVEELPPGGAPVPVRLLGEDLVLFRDGAGRPGLVGLHCSHRGADLSYGRIEDGGLRCIYHGWLYDVHGRCLEQPGEPAGQAGLASERGNASDNPLLAAGPARFHERIRHTAYPCIERSGAIFAYLGPGEPPLFPNWEFLSVPEPQAGAIKLFCDCNYLQGNEGNIDLIHSSFLHYYRRPGSGGAQEPLSSRGVAPHEEWVESEVADYGLRVCQFSPVGGGKYLLDIYTFLLPNAFCFGGGQWSDEGHSVNWHVPIDDEHHWKYVFTFRRNALIDQEAFRRGHGELTDDYRPRRNRANRYLQDRASMVGESYSGIGFANPPQDVCVTEGMGPIQDRTQEHLGAIDATVVAARLMLLKAIQDVQQGGEAPYVLRDSSRNRFPWFVYKAHVSAGFDWKRYYKRMDLERLATTEALPAPER